MLLKIISFVAISIVITLAIATGLILSQKPGGAAVPKGGGLNFSEIMARGIQAVPEPEKIPMSDGWTMPVRRFGEHAPSNAPLVIMIHGSGWNGLQFASLANMLSDKAHVLVPDLRGHGADPERRGDVDYIGQMEDDLADLIAAERKPDQRVILLGHSSGGGFVTRFAGGTHGALMDRAILLAPFLKHDAPTTRPNSGGWAHVLLRRIIGLSMLNTFGITALNHLTIIEFAMPQAVIDGPYGDLATTAYSYRLNTGFAPRGDYLADIAALPDFLLVVGAQDEAFYADQYEDLMSSVTDKGQYHIVEGKDHFGVVDAPETLELIQGMLE